MLIYEFGGAAAHAGLLTVGLPGIGGRLTPAQVRAATSTMEDVVDQRPAVLVLENTHNVAGGRVWPLDELDAVVAVARAAGVGVHLDGARLLNAAVALGVPAAAIGSRVDTVTLCLSKGLGCPLRRPPGRACRPDGAGLAAEVPLRRRHAAGRDDGGGGDVRARPQRRAARRRPRAGAPARRGLARGGAAGRARPGRDQLRPDRQLAARPAPCRGARGPARGRRGDVADLRADAHPRGHPPRPRRRRRRAGARARAGGPRSAMSSPDAHLAETLDHLLGTRPGGAADAVGLGVRLPRRRGRLAARDRRRRRRVRPRRHARRRLPDRLDHEDVHGRPRDAARRRGPDRPRGAAADVPAGGAGRADGADGRSATSPASSASRRGRSGSRCSRRAARS